MTNPRPEPLDFTGALLEELGKRLTRKNYLSICNASEGDLSAEEESLLPDYAQTHRSSNGRTNDANE